MSDEEQAKPALRMIKWLVIVLIVISSGNFIRTFYLQDAAEKTYDAAVRVELTSIEGRDASVDTLRELRQIIADFQESNADGSVEERNRIISEALESIFRMENFLCGGPCPESG